MSFITSKTLLLLTFAILLPTIHATTVIQTSMKPEGGKVEVGAYWMMKCDVTESSNIIWYKWVGDISTRIGYNGLVSGSKGDVISAGRFKLKAESSVGSMMSTLYLSNAQMEDSGRFECVADKTRASSVFVVCQDVESDECDCMMRDKWANPMCFPQEYTDMSGHYKRLLAGLGITLAVVSLYVVAATLLYGRDCIMLFHKDRLEDKEKRKRRKIGRVEFSRCKNKRDAVEIFNHPNDSDQAHLATSETVSEASGETAGASEDSGFSGSTQKDKKKLNYRGRRNNTTSNNDYSHNNTDSNTINNTNKNTNNNNETIPQQANINYAYDNNNDEENDYKKWKLPKKPDIKSVSSNLKTPAKQEFPGTMI